MSLQEDIQTLKSEALSRLMDTVNKEDLEEIRVDYLGRKGKLNQFFKEIKDLHAEEKKQAGLLINDVKRAITVALEDRDINVSKKDEYFDPTIPGVKTNTGSLHVVTKAIEEISDVFKQIGFVRSRYPEVEWDWHAFESLNFDKLHPARDDWETFHMDHDPSKEYGPMILTPHTSSGQVREMERVKNTLPDGRQAPIRMINIAKCYRRQSDVSHVPMFHQFEGLVVDKDISVVHLKGTLDYFAKNFFGEGRKTRIRPYNFPFTEPSFEVDISCDVCGGKGCRLCKEGWLEIGGSGMVHPNVLRAGGIDPEEYSGFAFGWGVERVYMMKSGLSVPDIRMLYSPDLRFLRQF